MLASTADGRGLQRRFGFVRLKRSRSPQGYLTRLRAEARLRAILDGRDESVSAEAAFDRGLSIAESGSLFLSGGNMINPGRINK
jgi:hypothetical protein